MAVNTSTSTGLSQRVLTYAHQEMLAHVPPVEVLAKLGHQKQMPRNRGVNPIFRRPVPYEPATTPLVEGVTPKPGRVTFEDVPTTMRQYGEVRDITDVIEDTHEDPVLNEMVQLAGENIGRTKEALIWATVCAGTNVYYSGTATQRTDVLAPVSLGLVRNVVRGLERQGAMKLTSILGPSEDFATRPIEAAYIAVGHSDLANDIRNLPGFTKRAEYATTDRMISPYEIGAVEDVRFVLSRDLDPFLGAGSTTTTGVLSTGSRVDVYPLVVFGKDAFGTVALRGKDSVSPTVIPPGQKTKDDPLGQVGKVGWLMWHASVILNQAWMARAEVACSSL